MAEDTLDSAGEPLRSGSPADPLPEKRHHAPSDRLRDVYERRAELQYAAPVPLPDPRLDRKLERVLELVAAQLPAGRFLDAGCGDGRHLAAVARLPDPPVSSTGTDIAERILATARLTAGPGPKLVRANLESLPFPDESFDLVLCTQVVEHLLDPLRGLREIVRVLAPGGRAVITTDHSGNLVTRILNAPRTAAVRVLGLRGRRKRVSFPHRDFARDEFVALVETAGLKVLHHETFRFTLLSPLGWRPIVRALNALDRRIGSHRVGDIIAVVARKPR